VKHWTAKALVGVLAVCCLVAVVGLLRMDRKPSQPAHAQAVSPPPIPESLKLPWYEMPEPNGYVELEALLAEQGDRPRESFDLYDQVQRHDTTSPSLDALAEAHHAVEANRAILDRLPEMLELEWLYPRQQTPGSLYPEVLAARGLVRSLTLRSVIEEHDGNADQAAETLVVALRLGVKLPRGGAVIPWLVGRSCEAIHHTEVRPLLTSGKLSEQTLRSMLTTMDALDAQRVTAREAIAFDYDARGPGALTLSAAESWELMGGPPNTVLPLGDPQADDVTRQFIVDRLPPLVAFDAELAELSTHPFWEISHTIPDIPDGLPDPEEDDALVFLPVPPKVLQKAARFDCDWLATELMVRLELARLADGAYPEALTDLEGVTDEDVVDPLTGEPLVYRKVGDSYVLYSISLDGVDNGGNMGENYGTQFEEGGDFIIWDGPAGE